MKRRPHSSRLQDALGLALGAAARRLPAAHAALPRAHGRGGLRARARACWRTSWAEPVRARGRHRQPGQRRAHAHHRAGGRHVRARAPGATSSRAAGRGARAPAACAASSRWTRRAACARTWAAALPVGAEVPELARDRLELARVFAGERAASQVLFAGSDGRLYKTGYAPVRQDGRGGGRGGRGGQRGLLRPAAAAVARLRAWPRRGARRCSRSWRCSPRAGWPARCGG